MGTARTKFVLVRHGQTESNASGRFQGRQDVPLNRVGRKQAADASVRIAQLKPARIVSSPLLRAAETAQILGEACELEVAYDERLVEIDVGSWQGRTAADVAAENPWYEAAFRSGEDFRRSETGETGMEAGERVAGVLRELAEAHAGETIAVVSHGFALRIGMCLFTGLGFEAAGIMSGLWNCSWTILDGTDRWRIQSYNNVLAGHSGPASASSR